MKVHERLINYAKIDTTSEESSTTCPSTPGQLELARLLKDELEELGLTTSLSEDGYLFGHLKANSKKDVYHLGFLAHLDTAPDAPGKNVNPRIYLYEGGDIKLESGLVISPKDFPNLKNYVGEELILTDGRTLLGADDKAGIAAVMEALKRLKENPDILHGNISVAFTPDEEIGRGPHKFDVEGFGAEFAYTIDGGPVGELEFENFNAAGAEITFIGRSVHPGTAKDQMISALHMAMDFEKALPEFEKPMYTEKYEGFTHLNGLNGNVGRAVSQYIIRDHDQAKFLEKKARVEELVAAMREKYGKDMVLLEMKDSYYNMREKIEPVMFMIDYAKEAMENLGILPIIKPIRGGTDGAQLSYKGLPCPNLFTGGENFHGPYEFISVKALEQSADLVLELIQVYEKKGKH
ncbi:MAG: peptidase T [Tissierellia bacterium]|nr:peptidase T [Tissierellia bacterium]